MTDHRKAGGGVENAGMKFGRPNSRAGKCRAGKCKTAKYRTKHF